MTADDVLAERLRDLGAHLDLGPVDTVEGRAERAAAVADRLRPDRAARRSSRVLAVAAALVVAAAVVAASPARDAVAGWLGIGAVEVRTRPAPLDDLPPPAPPAPGPVDLDAARAALPFPLRLPPAALVGAPVAVTLDPDVPDLVEVRYRDVTLVEVASGPGLAPSLTKDVGPGTDVTPVDVGGRPGLWISGDPHRVSHVGPDGAIVADSVRRAGAVLVWEDDGVTYRIEGAASRRAALALAAALR